MIKDIDGAAIAASVRMERQVKRRKSFLILEGIDDIAVFAQFVDPESCELINGFRKQNVIDAIHLLEDDGYVGVCGVIDKDYDEILGIKVESDNIVRTEYHDLDVVIFMSPALEKYLSIVTDPQRVAAFEKRLGTDLRTSLLSAAAVIGATRVAALQKGLKIYFQNSEIYKFVNPENLSIADEIYQYLVDRSHNPNCNAKQLAALAQDVLGRDPAKSMLCQGHDVAEILGVGLQKAFGERRIAQTWGSEIEKGLRLAFDRDCFWSTGVCAELQAWEKRNAPWRLLKAI